MGPLNESVNRLNALATAMLPDVAKTYRHGQDKVSDMEYGGHYPTEFLNGLYP